MELLLTIIIGIIAGWAAGMLMRGGGYGMVGDLVLGILGALIGRWIFSAAGFSTYGIIGSLVISIIGAVILISITRVLKRV